MQNQAQQSHTQLRALLASDAEIEGEIGGARGGDGTEQSGEAIGWASADKF